MSGIKGDVILPAYWTVFAPFRRSDPAVADENLRRVPDQLVVNGAKILPRKVTPLRGQFDFQEMFGGPPDNLEKTAYVYLVLQADRAGEATLGLGWDCWLDAWLNGQPLLEKPEANDSNYPPTVADRLLTVALEQGENILVLRYVSGLGPPILAVAGPQELRTGDFRCIADDMLLK
ncbi:MAG: hypothetical protein LC725_02740, partial [Lentisphaerae bacterium]|nr:hypothetical protein [Lentisphaerota bacterium]